MLHFPTAPPPPRADSLLAAPIISSPSETIIHVGTEVEDAQRVLESEVADEQELRQVLGRMISRVQELVTFHYDCFISYAHHCTQL